MYVDAFERFDIESLVQLLHEDATMSMPPYPLWLQGAGELGTWLRGPGQRVPWLAAASPVDANGAPGVRAVAGHARRRLRGVVRSTSCASQTAGSPAIDFFVDQNLFPLFDLPIRITG